MTWQRRTWFEGSGDVAFSICRRHYRYYFRDKPHQVLAPYRAEINLPFDSQFKSSLAPISRRVEAEAMEILHDPDFSVNGRDIMTWMTTVVHEGKVDLRFVVDPGNIRAMFRRAAGAECPEKLTLCARFTDKNLALRFKLAFG